MENKSRLAEDLKALKLKKFNNPEEEKPIEKKPVMNKTVKKAEASASQETLVPPEKLQEAIIWSEILGKPVSKRRKRR